MVTNFIVLSPTSSYIVRVKGAEYMKNQNWDEIADKEFNAMDKEAQQQWAELRKRLGV